MFILSNGACIVCFLVGNLSRGLEMQSPDDEEIKFYCMPKTLINLNDSLRRFCIDEHYWDLEDEETLSRGRSAVCEVGGA